jgi:hypothetical protein
VWALAVVFGDGSRGAVVAAARSWKRPALIPCGSLGENEYVLRVI